MDDVIVEFGGRRFDGRSHSDSNWWFTRDGLDGWYDPAENRYEDEPIPGADGAFDPVDVYVGARRFTFRGRNKASTEGHADREVRTWAAALVKSTDLGSASTPTAAGCTSDARRSAAGPSSDASPTSSPSSRSSSGRRTPASTACSRTLPVELSPQHPADSRSQSSTERSTSTPPASSISRRVPDRQSRHRAILARLPRERSDRRLHRHSESPRWSTRERRPHGSSSCSRRTREDGRC